MVRVVVDGSFGREEESGEGLGRRIEALILVREEESKGVVCKEAMDVCVDEIEFGNFGDENENKIER